jgi:alkane 1-monooxygenase
MEDIKLTTPHSDWQDEKTNAPDHVNTVEKKPTAKEILNPTKPENLNRYYWAFLPLVLALIGNILGGFFTLLPILLFAILIPLDFVIKDKSKVEVKDEKNISNKILFWMSGLQFAVIITFLWKMALVNQSLYGISYGNWILPAILGNGLVIGLAVSGGAHELLHRREQNLKDLGTAQLATIGYGHYTVEHIQGHHRNVGYAGDPSTANKGQNFYSFLINALKQEFTDAWSYEAARFTKKNLSPNTMENQVYKWTVYSGVFYLAILLFCGIFGLFSYLLISLIAVGYHSMIVYSQHYGLVKDPDNRVDDTISWQTDSVITENFVLGFGNHSDHHTRVTKTYTEIVQKEDGPLMPCGYFGIIPLALIPSIWFKYFGK